MIFRIKYFILGIFFTAVMSEVGHLRENSPSIEDQMHKEFKIRKKSLRSNIKENFYIVEPSDKNRLFDCYDESCKCNSITTMKPHYRYMNIFEPKMWKEKKIVAMMDSGNFPVLLYLDFLGRAGYDNPQYVLNFRGHSAGIHRSMTTTPLYRMVEDLETPMLMLPDSYVKLEPEKTFDKSRLRALCHGSKYEGVGWIDAEWPAFMKSSSWEIVNKTLGKDARLYIFSYSNGNEGRADLIRTERIGKYRPDFTHAFNKEIFLDEYRKNTRFARKETSEKIYSLGDIETNYRNNHTLWDLIKFIKEVVEPDSSRMYYGVTSVKMFPVKNYIAMIQALNMVGIESKQGIIRYQNAQRNVIIDIITHQVPNPYLGDKGVDLTRDTVFLPDYRVRSRKVFNKYAHYSVIPYTIEQYKLLAKERKLFTPVYDRKVLGHKFK